MTVLFELLLVGGLLAVASNPSPYYAALGLVLSAGAGCLLLAAGGISFLSLVLFLVYLGGMMVVFAYSAALVAEPYPVAWGNVEVATYLVGFIAMMIFSWFIGGEWGGAEEIVVEIEVWVSDWAGVSIFFSWGGGLLLIVGWGLLLTLFVVLEVVRGHYSGVLRAV